MRAKAINTPTVRQRLLGFLQSHKGERFTVFQLREPIGAMDNTINKELHFLRQLGYDIKGAKVDGKEYKEHWLAS